MSASDREELAERLGRSVPESEVEAAIALRLEPSGIDGLGLHMDVRDAASGALRLAHDFRPRGPAAPPRARPSPRS